MMEKGITVRGGQAPFQKYWHDLLKILDKGQVDPTVIITHGNRDLEEAAHLYDVFDRKADGCIKCVMRTPYGRQMGNSIFDKAQESRPAA